MLYRELVMMRRRVVLILAGAAVALALGAWPDAAGARAAVAPLPSRLTDQEFWKIVSDSSEPSGTFHSENLVSNEARFQGILPRLSGVAVPGRAYVGVGSEQNFTYITAVRPVVAIIVDLRRGNLDLHLAYKAIFEMSADRAEFVSRLFSRARPAGLGPASTANEIFAAYAKVAPSQALYDQNLKSIEAHLVTRHGFTLSAGDRDGLAFVYGSWFAFGPDLRYQLTTGFGGAPGGAGGRGGRGATVGPGGGSPTYADLMTADDGAGRQRSYLATEDHFTFMKDLETRNMLVPVVGNFAGPKALRAVAAWLKQKDQIVSVFYLSNVEQYLRQDNIWDAFCANAATLPIDKTSTFIRSVRGGGGFELALAPIAPDVARCSGR
jgi:hypothetical protein